MNRRGFFGIILGAIASATMRLKRGPSPPEEIVWEPAAGEFGPFRYVALFKAEATGDEWDIEFDENGEILCDANSVDSHNLIAWWEYPHEIRNGETINLPEKIKVGLT